MLLKRQYLYSSGWLILLHFFKKNLGRVPGVLFFAVILKKKLGRVPGVFWACCFCFILLQKFLGVFRACSVCSSVFSVLFLLTHIKVKLEEILSKKSATNWALKPRGILKLSKLILDQGLVHIYLTS